MADPKVLFDNLPPAYDRSPNRDLYKLLAGLAKSGEDAFLALLGFLNDLTIVRATGDGMDIVGENYGIARPPGIRDGRLGLVIKTLMPARRGTRQAIRSVIEAVTGIGTVVVDDKETNAFIPEYQIWVTVSPGTDPSQGRGFYPETVAASSADGFPLWSSVAGVALDETNYWSGLFNDHFWSPLDYWTMQFLNEVKLAGTLLVYFES